jgi:hypothetical protein
MRFISTLTANAIQREDKNEGKHIKFKNISKTPIDKLPGIAQLGISAALLVRDTCIRRQRTRCPCTSRMNLLLRIFPVDLHILNNQKGIRLRPEHIHCLDCNTCFSQWSLSLLLLVHRKHYCHWQMLDLQRRSMRQIQRCNSIFSCSTQSQKRITWKARAPRSGVPGQL